MIIVVYFVGFIGLCCYFYNVLFVRISNVESFILEIRKLSGVWILILIIFILFDKFMLGLDSLD